MQSLAYPGCSDLPSFQSHRFQAQRLEAFLRLNLAEPYPRPSWASLPSPPMSGSPPRRNLTEPPQIAGHRRKRSESPPTSPPASLPASLPRQYSASTSEVGQIAQTATAVERQVQPASYFPPYGAGPSYSYGEGVPISSMTTTLQESQTGYTQVSPRATRKVKAHVASACVNCKKKHLRCDSARPCTRCLQSGKESTCYDVEHRKRGRPPLKPEDQSTRASFGQSSTSMPAATHSLSRRGSHPNLGLQSQPSTSTWRDIRPIMSRGVSDSSRLMYPPGLSFSSIYAQPSIASSATTGMGTMTPMERSSYQGPASQQHAYALQSQMGYGNPSYETYQQPQSQPRTYPGYVPQQAYGQPVPTNYTYSSYQRPTPVPPIPEEGPVGLYGTSSLQLPPILPAPQGQAVEPAMAQQHRPSQPQLQYYPGEQPLEQGSSERPDAKRPRMDLGRILDPRNE